MTETFEQFAIVELFGHNIIAGKVSEQVIGGQGFVRVDVPAVDGQDGFTKLYGPGAIYSITPTDEATMLAAVRGLRQKPIEVWKLNLPQLPDVGPADDPDDEEFEGYDLSDIFPILDEPAARDSSEGETDEPVSP